MPGPLPSGNRPDWGCAFALQTLLLFIALVVLVLAA